MKNIIEKIKRKDNISVFILFFLISLGISLNISLESSDEVWNFQNIYKMYNGFKIYEDINVIITPLFFWMTEGIFKIFGANLFVFRVTHCFIMATLFLFTYKILKKINVPKALSLLTILIICLQEFFMLIRTSFNYNNVALLFFIIGVYYLINEKTRKNVFIQSIITFLIIITKQNMGVYYLLGNIIYLSISKNSIKDKIKENFTYISIILLGGIAFILYMIIDNNLYNFINYTLGGISEFANENLNFDFSSILFIISIVLINICVSIILLKKKFISLSQKENIKILLIFSTMLAIVCYPIFNWAHVIIGSCLIIINIVYMMYILFEDLKNSIQKILKYIDGIILLAMLIFSAFNMYIFINVIIDEDYPYSWEDPFFGGIIGKEEYEKNERVINYIEENDKNVIVFSNRAVLYMVPLKRNNGDFDLPFKGNLGIKGEMGLIEKVDKTTNAQFLIFKEESESIYQESDKAKEHIKNTKKCIGEIEGFEIYE